MRGDVGHRFLRSAQHSSYSQRWFVTDTPTVPTLRKQHCRAKHAPSARACIPSEGELYTAAKPSMPCPVCEQANAGYRRCQDVTSRTPAPQGSTDILQNSSAGLLSALQLSPRVSAARDGELSGGSNVL